MLPDGFMAGLWVGVLLSLLCVLVAKRRQNTKVGTPSASHNSRYMAALQAMDEFSNGGLLSHYSLVKFEQFCQQRLNAEKAPHCI